MGSLKFGELLNKNMKNPSDISLSNSNIFGLDCDFDASNIVILPVPWDVTTSYRRGTSMGPESLKISSSQIEIYDEYLGNIWKAGIFCEKVAASWVAWNDRLSYVSKKIISGLEDGDDINSHAFHLKYVNAQSEEFFSEVLSRIERFSCADSSKFSGKTKIKELPLPGSLSSVSSPSKSSAIAREIASPKPVPP